MAAMGPHALKGAGQRERGPDAPPDAPEAAPRQRQEACPAGKPVCGGVCVFAAR